MLWVSSVVDKYKVFRELFWSSHSVVIDLSKVPSSELANECDSITRHHTNCAVFLGYLEPGWMIDSSHQTRIRSLIRKFKVGIVLHYPESLPHSWKNEIDIFYTDKPLNQNGNPDSINDGSSLQDQSNV